MACFCWLSCGDGIQFKLCRDAFKPSRSDPPLTSPASFSCSYKLNSNCIQPLHVSQIQHSSSCLHVLVHAVPAAWMLFLSFFKNLGYYLDSAPISATSGFGVGGDYPDFPELNTATLYSLWNGAQIIRQNLHYLLAWLSLFCLYILAQYQAIIAAHSSFI